MYDIIGDIHGHADKLEALLVKMGYGAQGDGYVAPAGRKAVFVGDLIDRGPAQLRVLRVVRAMVESGHALAVMGNHEFNAIGYATMSTDYVNHLRLRSKKNTGQHQHFLAEVGRDSDTHRSWVEWFKTLPLFLNLNGIRVAHAWFDEAAAKEVDSCYWGPCGAVMSDEFLFGSYVAGSKLMAARKLLTCGHEWVLPKGNFIADKEGNQHGDARLAVWRHAATSLRDIALVPNGSAHLVPDIKLPAEVVLQEVTGTPIFFGHHWFTGTPKLESSRVACVDWSAAKEGPLVAYRWDGELELQNDKFIWADGPASKE